MPGVSSVIDTEKLEGSALLVLDETRGGGTGM